MGKRLEAVATGKFILGDHIRADEGREENKGRDIGGAITELVVKKRTKGESGMSPHN